MLGPERRAQLADGVQVLEPLAVRTAESNRRRRTPEPVRSYATFTEDLHRLADWLKSCGIETVAMESTSVYWIPLFQILEARGFEVCLVNGTVLPKRPRP